MTAKDKLCKAYSKRLKLLNASFFNNINIGIELFVEYLKYVRDLRLISSTCNVYENEQEKACMASIMAAIAEFEAWQTCKEDQKQFHWNNFMELTKQNFMEWITPNDTI